MGCTGGSHRDARTLPTAKSVRTRADLQQWIRVRLPLSGATAQALLEAVDQVLVHHERCWRDSKDEALHAVAAGVTHRVNRIRRELAAREATANKIVQYYEQLVGDLAEQVHRDAKTQLLNFQKFMEQLELYLTLKRPAPWCALGVVDITSFKTYNDTLGHAAGDRIIAGVARLLRAEVRSSDHIGYVQPEPPHHASPLHARFGGDEFCFFLPNLSDGTVARTVAERFWKAVARYDWSAQDPRIASNTVNVDIGVVCFHVSAHTPSDQARRIAEELFARADDASYAAKRGGNPSIAYQYVQVEEGRVSLLASGPSSWESYREA